MPETPLAPLTPVTAALLEELRRLARQLAPNDTPATVFSA